MSNVSNQANSRTELTKQAAEYNLNNFCSFLKTNGLTHVIRGHESPREGYQFQFGGRCITISAAIPDPMVVFVDNSNETIRLVRVQMEQTDAAASSG